MLRVLSCADAAEEQTRASSNEVANFIFMFFTIPPPAETRSPPLGCTHHRKNYPDVIESIVSHPDFPDVKDGKEFLQFGQCWSRSRLSRNRERMIYCLSKMPWSPAA
jgi:hypothetical protein